MGYIRFENIVKNFGSTQILKINDVSPLVRDNKIRTGGANINTKDWRQ